MLIFTNLQRKNFKQLNHIRVNIIIPLEETNQLLLLRSLQSLDAFSDKAYVTLDTIKGDSVWVCAQTLVCVFYWVTSASFTEVKWGQI